MDVLTLSRAQFALTIMFHYLFPPLSIGLGALMVLMEGMYLRTNDARYHAMTKFWTGIFAANFAMGVATGLVMEFQFGTNWGAYARYVGDVFGSALAAEGIFAFFLESGFLAVLVFGWDRVSKGMHFFATLMVSLGSIFSAVWIIIANSWQQTPAGFRLVERDGAVRAEVADLWAVLLNPSSVQRLSHVILGSFILGAFFVMSISAYFVLRRRHLDFAKKSFTIALIFGAISSLVTALSGHFMAKEVAENQPAKLAALEGHFKTGPADLHLAGLPDPAAGRVDYGVAVPGGLSFLVHESFTAPVPGLEEFPRDDWPNVPLVFQTYHLMVGLGTLFIVLTLLALFFLWRRTLFEKRWLMAVFVVAVAGPYVANQAGWVSAEAGRQPFVVYPKTHWPEDGSPHPRWEMAKGDIFLRTADGLSNRDVVGADQVLGSIVLFSLVYVLLFAVWVYVLNTKIHHGPDEAAAPPPPETKPEGLAEAAARRANPSGFSLTEVRRGQQKAGRPQE
jgi:cytochrome d ubiquinol oxidase subunit I